MGTYWEMRVSVWALCVLAALAFASADAAPIVQKSTYHGIKIEETKTPPAHDGVPAAGAADLGEGKAASMLDMMSMNEEQQMAALASSVDEKESDADKEKELKLKEAALGEERKDTAHRQAAGENKDMLITQKAAAQANAAKAHQKGTDALSRGDVGEAQKAMNDELDVVKEQQETETTGKNLMKARNDAAKMLSELGEDHYVPSKEHKKEESKFLGEAKGKPKHEQVVQKVMKPAVPQMASKEEADE